MKSAAFQASTSCFCPVFIFPAQEALLGRETFWNHMQAEHDRKCCEHETRNTHPAILQRPCYDSHSYHFHGHGGAGSYPETAIVASLQLRQTRDCSSHGLLRDKMASPCNWA
ncbi:uncharacterized protein BKA55DRAFT_569286 [Fusarium redolens]|uniref:Uncharacterized protein n=1 Tax=Fusarium redolens TaxID=48865 RepID=A0A9P9K5Q4_FUSRE|nr:uncharacterized protein BKA55DRAFT_569286 [Fusarium redolens]KAH7250377.1 hypothetical protein BKA55DRAFT_569286 [Fusarium redolens]